ncbi:MAG: cyclic-di-AMP phosphodiesterase PgpH [Thermosediminibacterales bacterium]|nr:cyclic-di-AMP phosphodiesterase PgpH [Thermosediminibacterales bacterium]MDK2835639.1 cyclic-di-AMP phosphodiesterase PgpH [Thermosediminibacterales bacterium]
MIFLERIRDMLTESFLGRYFKNSLFYAVIIETVLFILLVVIVVSSITPEKYNLKVGDIAPVDIQAPKNAINEVATKKLQEAAADSVPTKYTQNPEITDQVENNLKNFFQKVYEIRENDSLNDKERLEELKKSINIKLNDENLYTLLTAKIEDLKELEKNTLNLVKEILENGIKEDALDKAKTLITSGFYEYNMSRDLTSLGVEIAKNTIKPNMVFDKAATEKSKLEAINSVQPVMITKGEIIVEKGHKITEENLEIMKSLNLVAQDNKAYVNLVLGAVILVALLMTLMLIYIKFFSSSFFKKRRYITLLGLIILTVLLIGKGLYQISGYLIPVAAGSVLIAILLNPRTAVLVNLIMSVLVGLITGNVFKYVIVAIIGGITGIYGVTKVNQRSDLTRAGFLVAFTNMVTIIGLGLIDNGPLLEVLKQSMWGIVNGVFSAVLAIGSLPFLENAFGITSSVKLLELSNPNQPLLKKLLLEAPGTYHHSIIVGNLAEAAAEEVGGEPLLARVGAYYHDIGKTKRPYFFIENQLTSENPHDKITPSLSSLIITSHVKDGVEIAKKNGIPDVIIDIIQQHHGTSLLSYFYHEALQQDTADSVQESNFRYEGPLPQTKEAAIVMLADCVEAAVRSLSNPTSGRIEGMVRQIIKNKLNDGQLDECDLTLKDLDKIARAFSKVLMGIFHTRIEYPQALKDLERGKQKNDSNGKKSSNKGRNK